MSANTLFDNTGGATLVTDGPILGATEPALHIPAGDYLTTTDLTTGNGDAGDTGGTINYAIEFWFRTPTVGTQQILAQGPNAHAAVPNRQWTIYLTALSGNIRFDYVDSTNTNHTLTGLTPLKTGTWYHVVCTKDSTQRIYINGVQDGIQAAVAGQWGDLIAGSADMRIGSSTSTYAMDFAEFAFYRQSFSATTALNHYQAGAQRGFPQQSTYARVLGVLDQIEIPTFLTYPAGVGVNGHSVGTITSRYMTGQPALDLINEAMLCEFSATDGNALFFVDGSGLLQFFPADYRSFPPYNASQATFGDGGIEVLEIPYVSIELDYSDSYIANDVTVTREGSATVAGITQEVSDATSIAAYGRRPFDISGIPVVADSDALNLATSRVAKYKDPMARVTSIQFSLVMPEVSEAVFQREIGDKISVIRNPPGAAEDVFIQKIEISGTNDGTPLTVKWAVTPL